MRKKTSILVVSFVLLLTAAVTVTASSWGTGGQMGINCGIVGNQRYWAGGQIDLELTPVQEEKMLTIRQELVKETLELRQKLQRLNLELRRLWEANPPNQTAINQKLTEMTPLRVELSSKSQQAQKEIESILTPEHNRNCYAKVNSLARL